MRVAIWDRMFQIAKSEQRQKRTVQVDAGTWSLVDLFPSVEKRGWANAKHRVVKRDRHEVVRVCIFLVDRGRLRHLQDAAVTRPNSLTLVVCFRMKVF